MLHVIMGGETCCTPLIESPTNTRSAHLYICGCMLVCVCVCVYTCTQKGI